MNAKARRNIVKAAALLEAEEARLGLPCVLIKLLYHHNFYCVLYRTEIERAGETRYALRWAVRVIGGGTFEGENRGIIGISTNPNKWGPELRIPVLEERKRKGKVVVEVARHRDEHGRLRETYANDIDDEEGGGFL